MKKFNDISIRNKLVIIQATTAFLALVVCCALFVVNGIGTFRSSTERKMESLARIVGSNSVSALVFMDPQADSAILRKLSQETDIVDAMVFDKKGKLFASYKRDGPALSNPNVTFPRQDERSTATFEFYKNMLIVKNRIYNENDLVGTIVIRSELSDLKKILKGYLMVAAMVLFAGLLAAVVFSFILQKAISRRLLSLVGKTKEVIETGNFSVRVTSGDEDEIGILSKEFNELMVQIDEMQKSLKEANADLEKRVEQRTVELETANRELESFSYSVSHDLKAPLRAINGFTEMLVKKYADKIDDKGKEMAGVIVANSKKMGQLIEDLLEFSRIGRKEMVMTAISMDEIVQQVLADAQNTNKDRNIEVKKEKLPDAKGDRNLLTQVWTNLISNAFKYTSHKEKAVIAIGSYDKDDEHVYFIKDNGAGFDMKYQDKLFKVFQRLHGSDEFEGTGVGLANVNRIVTRHGGRVWAEAKVNEGATFYFTLPIPGKNETSAPAEAAK
jgi:signal transduction histidine kinase